MPRRRGFVTVTNRQQRLRITNTTVIRAQETMVDLMTGSSLFDILDFGLVDLMRKSDYDQRYSDEEEEYNYKYNQPQKLKPHPQLKELDDEYADQIKQSLQEDEKKRQSKSIKNKRKKMRKKERKRQEKEDGLLQEEEQGKSDSSEYEDVNGETSVGESYAETSSKSENLTGDNYNNEVIVKEETTVQLDKKEDNCPENIFLKKNMACITETIPESRIVDEKVEEHKEVIPVVDQYTIRSKQLAAFGNRLAANEQYDEAIKCFTEAIKLNPQEYKLFGNRSFCFEKIQQFDEALSDAEIALSMEPNWIKGLFRKGKALCGLKKYYEASLAYRDVLNLDRTSEEATAELKRSQSLHLMEMGFTLTQSLSALEKHSTLEEAIDALFNEQHEFNSEENVYFESDVSRAGHEKEWENVGSSTKDKPQTIERAQPLTVAKRQGHIEVFPVWVGSLAPSVGYVSLQEVFSRVGKVISIKMILEHQCAFVHYSSQEDCARAIQTLNGLVLEGCPLSVRYPNRLPPVMGISKRAVTDPLTPPSVEKECFFWRTIGCTRDNCTFQHVLQNRGIDRGKFTQKLVGSSISS
uniref:Tetratricopeptide repeat protein 31 n=1 Tax=Knipowitschia caucasica TaxID=637954 RepID=A0AAV2JDT2_KNICA